MTPEIIKQIDSLIEEYKVQFDIAVKGNRIERVGWLTGAIYGLQQAKQICEDQKPL